MPPPPKSYRRPRRPLAHLRTKTGCLTCRERRKKCDERQGVCHNCDRKWLKCVWPSQSRIDPPDHVQSESSTTGPSRSRTNSPLGETNGLMKTSSVEVLDGAHTTSHAADHLPCTFLDEGIHTSFEGDYRGASSLTKLPITVPFYAGIIPLGSGLLFDLLQIKWLRQLIRPMASASLIELYYRESMRIAMHTPFYMQSLLACCAAEYPVDDINVREHFWRLSHNHYVRAITGLREALNAGQPKLHEEAIVSTVLTLCIFERAKPWPSSGVNTHLSGLAQLIQSELAWGGLGCPSPGSDSGASLRRVVLEGFIFHAATSVPFQPFPDQQNALDVAVQVAQERLEGMFDGRRMLEYPDSPVLGVRPRLFVLIREISLIHREYQLSHSEYNRCHRSWQTINMMREQLSQYRDFYSVGPKSSSESTPIGSGAPQSPVCDSDALLVGPMLYIIAAEILVADVIGYAYDHRHVTQTVTTIPELVEDGVKLVSQLQPSKDYYAEYYGWPIYVLTKFIEREKDRDCLLSQIDAFWKETRSGTMLRLADTLRNLVLVA
ncbi:hypothetical protein BJX63DRAFT_394443 [Aspergillus granulosus]|uniref:Zn(2)-C6 fungal-type domain-containing protein n=1 Tax=Aspergillus granulosus TaxID=176169 RepID=A0ABR4HD89_9EURO